ncbi:MAG: tetratricopeptide repeat protein [Bacteroidales bacterium]|nr:tetratricopeptide repeat protein [Bacteroidales bacterium]
MKRLLLLATCALMVVSCSNVNEGDNTKVKQQESVENQTDAREELRMVITDSLNADAYVQRARLYMSEEHVGDAMRDINTALSLDGDNIDALLVLADIYYALGDEDNIMLTLNKATEVAPYDTRPIIKLSELSFIQGNVRMADAYLDKALQINKINPQAYFMRGVISMSKNDTVQALKNFNLARNQDDSFFDPVIQIAAIYAAQHDDLAVDFYDLAISMQPDNWGVYYEKAMYLQDNGKPEEALSIYDTLNVKMPGNFDVIYNKGYVSLVYMLDYDKAIGYFNQALALKPDAVNALLNKGVAYEQKGDFIEAKSIYLQILRDNPNYQLAIDALHRIGD